MGDIFRQRFDVLLVFSLLIILLVIVVLRPGIPESSFFMGLTKTALAAFLTLISRDVIGQVTNKNKINNDSHASNSA